jgi:hypothetical protein
VIFAKRTGLWLAPIVDTIFLLPLIAAVYLTVVFLLKRFRITKRAAILIGVSIWGVPAGWALKSAYREGTPKARFERLVTRPMPASIRDFHWNGWVGMGGDQEFYVTFEADQTAAKAIIAHFRLVPMSDADHVGLDSSTPTQWICAIASFQTGVFRRSFRIILWHHQLPFEVPTTPNWDFMLI